MTISLVCTLRAFFVIVFSKSTLITAIGALVFALGAGLMTLVRPYLVQTVFSIERAGEFNVRIARQQQLARFGGAGCGRIAGQPADLFVSADGSGAVTS